MEQKIIKLIELCKWSFTIGYNPHIDNHQSVEQYFKEIDDNVGLDDEDVHPEVMALMIKKNIIFHIHYYPNNCVGFLSMFHYDLEECIDQIIAAIEEK